MPESLLIFINLTVSGRENVTLLEGSMSPWWGFWAIWRHRQPDAFLFIGWSFWVGGRVVRRGVRDCWAPYDKTKSRFTLLLVKLSSIRTINSVVLWNIFRYYFQMSERQWNLCVCGRAWRSLNLGLQGKCRVHKMKQWFKLIKKRGEKTELKEFFS